MADFWEQLEDRTSFLQNSSIVIFKLPHTQRTAQQTATMSLSTKIYKCCKLVHPYTLAYGYEFV
jgi:hypothetical protein